MHETSQPSEARSGSAAQPESRHYSLTCGPNSDLYTLPDRGRIVPELHDQGINIYREISVPPWRIIYRISDSTVYVLSVIDSRRNVEDILLNRFIR